MLNPQIRVRSAHQEKGPVKVIAITNNGKDKSSTGDSSNNSKNRKENNHNDGNNRSNTGDSSNNSNHSKVTLTRTIPTSTPQYLPADNNSSCAAGV